MWEKPGQGDLKWAGHLTLLATLALGNASCGGGEPAGAPPPDQSGTAAETASKMPPDLSQAGTLQGRVRLEGTPPRMPPISMDTEPDCARQHSGPLFSEEVVVDRQGMLQNVFVWVSAGLESYTFDPPPEAAVLDQAGCIFLPRVLGARAGQEIRFLNSDPITHNTHPLPQQNREWNVSQAAGKEVVRPFARPEIMIPVKCNMHPWMVAYIGIVSHPYFDVTGPGGAFELQNLPPGEYTLSVWHERYGTQQQSFTVDARGSHPIELTYVQ